MTRLKILRFAIFFIAAIGGALFMLGCSDSSEAILPSVPKLSISSPSLKAGHHLWGYWEGYIPESNDSMTLLPVREPQMHLNVRKFLEDSPCTNCIKILSVHPDQINKTLNVQIQLIHPFPGFPQYTGFDVRAVVITNGSLYFPALDARVPYADSGDFTLLNPDGYTRLWNTNEFAPGSGPFKILEYSKGKFASAGGFSSTVNPYIEFSLEPRSHFPPGQSITRSFVFNLVPGPKKFGYAVDASWAPPTVDPPKNILTDFPENANAIEPKVLGMMQYEPLNDQIGSYGYFNVDLVDRQSDFDYPSVLLEAPDIWNGAIEAEMWGVSPGEPFWHPFVVGFQIYNEYGVPEGEYPVLFRITDGILDPWLGDINHSYALSKVIVQHQELPQITGKIVFTAPGPPGPGGEPGALNVFLLDVETMEETQLTNYIGVGAIFTEPRINPKGTHMLLTFCPTPFASRVIVFDIASGTSWSATPAGFYDGTADFHPDGEHILAASGTQFDNIKQLVSMKYDGSDRIIIDSAPGNIRNPKWSPDGNRIAMTLFNNSTTESSLWIYDTKAGIFTELVPAEGLDEHPSWSPVKLNGHYLIAFDSNRYTFSDEVFDIYIVNPDTSEIVDIIVMSQPLRHPSFSPDGLSIVLSGPDWWGGSSTELYVYSFPTFEWFQLTMDDTYDGSPSWCWGW